MPGVITALNLRALAENGYLLQVDASYGPLRPMPYPGFNAPVELVQVGLQHVLGGGLTGRLFVAAALMMCGFAPMVLLRTKPWSAQCAAGFLGILNPWVYARLVEGQWGILAAAGLLFLWVAAWEKLHSRPSAQAAVALTTISVAVVALSDSFLPIVGTLFAGAILFQRVWRDQAWRRFVGLAMLLWSFLLLYGLIPALVGATPRSLALLQHIGRADWQTFASTPSPRFGLVVNLLGLHGYWAEPLGRFSTVGDAAWWPLATLVLTGLTVAGAWRSRTRRWLLPVGCVGIAVAASTATPEGLSAAVWLSAHLPILGVIREPQKFLSLWLLAVVTLAGEGAAGLVPARRPQVAQALASVMVAATLLPAGITQIAFVPETVRPVSYPESWYAAAAYEGARVPPNAPVLVLPWHAWEALPFTAGRLVHNPAFVFFPGRLSFSSNLELPGEEFKWDGSPIAQAASLPGDTSCTLAKQMVSAGIRWAIVEDAPDGWKDTNRLLTCGFRIAEGSIGSTVVLEAE